MKDIYAVNLLNTIENSEYMKFNHAPVLLKDEDIFSVIQTLNSLNMCLPHSQDLISILIQSLLNENKLLWNQIEEQNRIIKSYDESVKISN